MMATVRSVVYISKSNLHAVQTKYHKCKKSQGLVQKSTKISRLNKVNNKAKNSKSVRPS